MKAMDQRTAVGTVFGKFRVTMTWRAPTGDFAKDIHLHLVNKHPIADAEVISNPTPGLTQVKGWQETVTELPPDF